MEYDNLSRILKTKSMVILRYESKDTVYYTKEDHKNVIGAYSADKKTFNTKIYYTLADGNRVVPAQEGDVGAQVFTLLYNISTQTKKKKVINASATGVFKDVIYVEDKQSNTEIDTLNLFRLSNLCIDYVTNMQGTRLELVKMSDIDKHHLNEYVDAESMEVKIFNIFKTQNELRKYAVKYISYCIVTSLSEHYRMIK